MATSAGEPGTLPVAPLHTAAALLASLRGLADPTATVPSRPFVIRPAPAPRLGRVRQGW